MQKTIFLALGAILFSSLAMPVVAADTMSGMPKSGMPMSGIPMGGKLQLGASFNPAPPKQGAETIVVTVKDATGKPVKGATVKIATNMPTMAMSGPTLVARDSGNGTYAAKANLNFATTWVFAISASAGNRKGSMQLTEKIK